MHIETPARRQHAIGLTPLIDVVFILLIFFMLATSLTDWRGIGLTTGNSAAEADAQEPAVVRLDKQGQLHYRDNTHTADEVAALLNGQIQSGEVTAVVLRPDKRVTLGPTIRTLDSLAGAGVTGLTLGRAPAE